MKKKYNYFDAQEGMSVSSKTPSSQPSQPTSMDTKDQERALELMNLIRKERRALGININPIIQTPKGVATNEISADVVAVRILSHNFLNLIEKSKEEKKLNDATAKISIGGEAPSLPPSPRNTVMLGGPSAVAPSPQIANNPTVSITSGSAKPGSSADISVKGVGEVHSGPAISGGVKSDQPSDIAGQFQSHEHELKTIAYLIEILLYLSKYKEQFNLKIARDLTQKVNTEVASLDIPTIDIALKKLEESYAGISKEDKEKDIQYKTMKKSLESQKEYIQLKEELSKNPSKNQDADFMENFSKKQNQRVMYLGDLREQLQKEMKENEGNIGFKRNISRKDSDPKDLQMAILTSSLSERERLKALTDKSPETSGGLKKGAVSELASKTDTALNLTQTALNLLKR